MTERGTRERTLDVALDLFGTRGFDAVSLDEIARQVGVRKQTVLYWFPSKDELLDAVLDEVAGELVVVIDAAVRSAPADHPLERVDAIVRAVFRPAVRRPAMLGLIRELNRLPEAHVDRLRVRLQPLIDRCIGYFAQQMDKGELRRSEPGLVLAMAYATVTGVATEPEVLRAAGWQPTTTGLRQMRDELRSFLQAALRP
ncbi:MAG TPA: TetR/AcrR family transcriptional regulator [Ilumatobacter sp.]|nr:TetR/AcrR family transcriptional regulator [Ilumatobacter sp.]